MNGKAAHLMGLTLIAVESAIFLRHEADAANMGLCCPELSVEQIMISTPLHINNPFCMPPPIPDTNSRYSLAQNLGLLLHTNKPQANVIHM
jgi:hypothetical protein